MGHTDCACPEERWFRQTLWWLQDHSESRTTSRAVPSSSHWRHLYKPCWWAEILTDWPPPSISPNRDGRRFKEIHHNQHPYGTVSVQPTSVWHHLCTCYLAAHLWSSVRRNVWNKLYPCRYDHHWKEWWWASCQPRSFTSPTPSWVKSKQDKVRVFQREDNLLRTRYWKSWSPQVTRESGSSFESASPMQCSWTKVVSGVSQLLQQLLAQSVNSGTPFETSC